MLDMDTSVISRTDVTRCHHLNSWVCCESSQRREVLVHEWKVPVLFARWVEFLFVLVLHAWVAIFEGHMYETP